MKYTQDDIDSLAAKLAAADLTEGEQAVMEALVVAAEGEVAGFSSRPDDSGVFWFTSLRPGEFLVAHEITHIQPGSQDGHGVTKFGGGSDI